jgi:LmbE family N-acetylglucosaminyl deacetylase
MRKKLNCRMQALNRTESHPIHGKNILLVIAHPDDEVMFFGPTLIGITNSSNENNVRVLCLSNGTFFLNELTLGDADGLGHIRERELQDSLRHFGIDQVETLNHEYILMIPC